MSNLTVVSKDQDKDIIDNITAGIKINEDAHRREIARQHDFYKIKVKDGKLEDIFVDKVKLVNKFIELGFFRLDTQNDEFIMVKIQNNTIRRVSSIYIRDCFFDWVEKLETNIIEKEGEMGTIEIKVSGEYIKSKLYRSLETYFSKLIFERVRSSKKIEVQKDTKDVKYFFFKNCFVSINKDGYKTHNYSDLENYVWETSILQNNFQYTEEKGNYEKFFENITGNDPERKDSLMSIDGYLLHTFYDYKTFLILLTDAGLTENGEPNGRTGKSLKFKALGKMLNANDGNSGYIEIDGKTFKSDDDRKYQMADFDTSLIHINDIFTKFKIDSLFTDITEGLIINKKHEQPFRIVPKLAMSSNKTIKLDGVSARDRVVVFELNNHYNEKLNPSIEFKQWFFRDWDAIEWNKFYSFMIRCCIKFFKEGILKPAEINYSQRILSEHTAPEFISWINEYLVIIESEMKLTGKDVERSKKSMYLNILDQYMDLKNTKYFSQRIMTKWMRAALDWKKLPYEERRSSADVFVFINPNKIESNNPDEFNYDQDKKTDGKQKNLF